MERTAAQPGSKRTSGVRIHRMRSKLTALAFQDQVIRPFGPVPAVKIDPGTARRFRSSVCSALNERVPPVCAAGRTLPIDGHRRSRVDNERLKQTSTVGRDLTGRQLIEFRWPFVVATAVQQS